MITRQYRTQAGITLCTMQRFEGDATLAFLVVHGVPSPLSIPACHEANRETWIDGLCEWIDERAETEPAPGPAGSEASYIDMAVEDPRGFVDAWRRVRQNNRPPLRILYRPAEKNIDSIAEILRLLSETGAVEIRLEMDPSWAADPKELDVLISDANSRLSFSFVFSPSLICRSLAERGTPEGLEGDLKAISLFVENGFPFTVVACIDTAQTRQLHGILATLGVLTAGSPISIRHTGLPMPLDQLRFELNEALKEIINDEDLNPRKISLLGEVIPALISPPHAHLESNGRSNRYTFLEGRLKHDLSGASVDLPSSRESSSIDLGSFFAGRPKEFMPICNTCPFKCFCEGLPGASTNHSDGLAETRQTAADRDWHCASRYAAFEQLIHQLFREFTSIRESTPAAPTYMAALRGQDDAFSFSREICRIADVRIDKPAVSR